MKLINKQNRGLLAEGRNYGMGFAFCTVKDDVVTTTMALTACKDFLNDQIWSDKTGKPYKIYGLSTEPLGLFDGPVSHMVIGILPYNKGGAYHKMEADVAQLSGNYHKLQAFINNIESLLKLEELTSITPIEENRYLVTFPSFWTNATYLISLYTLLLRVGMYCGDEDALSYLATYNKSIDDKVYVDKSLPKLKAMIGGNIPEQDFSKLSSPHSVGIVNFPFPGLWKY